MNTKGQTVPSVTTVMQNRIYSVMDDLKRKIKKGDTDYIDSYEYGFLKACEMFNQAYGLNIDFREDTNE